jgi:SAM-dependent methyltransferase
MTFYAQNGQAFFDSTFQVDMESIYAPFLKKLPPAGIIVDAGCGSGRDALAFSRLGFQVVAFDASEQLAQLARENTGLDVKCCAFTEFRTEPQSIEAIWACASLLHVPFSQLAETFKHLATFLVPAGTFYCSFKYGDDQVERNGRLFTNLNEKLLADVITDTDLQIDQTWQTEDQRPERAGEFWLNAILVKC